MKAFIKAWSHFVIEKRILVIIIGLVSLVLAVLPMKNLKFDNSNEMWFVQGDPALVQYDQLVDLFGDNEYFLIGISARSGDKDLFTPETFEVIYKLTEFLENHETVTKVQSLSKYQVITADADEMVVRDLVAEYFEDFDGSAESMQAARSTMAKETLVHEQLITSDLRHTTINARSEYIKGGIDHHIKLVRDTKAFIAEQGFEEKGFKIRYTGTPAINETFFSASMDDQQLTLPLMFLLVVTFLVFTFRTWSGILLPLLIIIGSVLFTLGAVGAFGWSMNMLNAILPVMLMAVAIGDSVHILIEFYHFRGLGDDSKVAAQKAVEELFIPCFNTTVTTGIGFAAISISRLKPLNEFGIVAAIGVVMAFILSVTVMPAFLSFVKGPSKRASKITNEGRVAVFTSNLTEHVFKHRLGILLTCVVLSFAGFAGASRLSVDSNFINYFKDDQPIKEDLDYFIEEYNGGMFLEYIVDTGRGRSEEMSGGALDPKTLKRVKEFEEWLMSQPESGKTISMVDMIRKMNQSMNGDDPAFFTVPDSRQLVAQYLLLYSNSGPDEDLSDQKTGDERYLRISQRLTHMSSNKMLEFITRVKQKADTDFADLKMSVTGMPVLFTNMDAYIHQGIIQSFSAAIIAIAICFLILLRSVKYGLLAMIPSLFPILLAAGIMGFMGLYLNFISLVVASVTFGIAVDDAVHILTRYIKGREAGMSRKLSVNKAVSESGRALIYTSLILYFGFSILIVSTFVPNIQLGFFGGVILLLALIASLTLLPAVIFFQGDKE